MIKIEYYSICCAALLIAACVLIAMLGSPFAGKMAIYTLVFAAGSQYLAQINENWAYMLASLCVGAASISIILALVFL